MDHFRVNAVSNTQRKFTVATCVIMVERMGLIMCILVTLYVKVWNTILNSC